MQEITLRAFAAGDRDWLTRLHGQLYAREAGFDAGFEALVGQLLDRFLAGHDPRCEQGFVAMRAEARLGSIFCTRETGDCARLRLFLLRPEMRGQGLGRRMLLACTGFARRAGYRRMVLATHRSHRAACALYARSGWRETGSRPVSRFGCRLEEVQWETDL